MPTDGTENHAFNFTVRQRTAGQPSTELVNGKGTVHLTQKKERKKIFWIRFFLDQIFLDQDFLDQRMLNFVES